ncbi:MAG: helix-turn-helix domain-containing protein [Candidatus Nealsonbacteria bacterium]|nr:helix-turn-helix domain-containing protein [Candidatus Nealsonbacteria bacterium]
MKQQILFKVRDKRKEHRYYIDNEFLNGYAKNVGVYGQSVYMALCRHAKDETCFPSLKHLAIELGISIASAERGIKKLKACNIIVVERRGKTQSNVYWLLDRSEWKPVSNWSNQGKEYRPFKSIPVKAG